MLEHCSFSCKSCDVGEEVVDTAELDKCRLWARRGDCNNNPSFMLQHCKAACGIGEFVCADVAKYDDCRNWRSDGECELNPTFMRENCAASCGICAELEKHYTNILSGKDEL